AGTHPKRARAHPYVRDGPPRTRGGPCVNMCRGARAGAGSSAVPVQEVAERAEDRALLAAAAPGLRRRGVDPAREARERQRLEPHATGAAKDRVEQPLAPEQHRLDAAHELDVVVDARLHGHDAARVHAQRLAGGEGALLERAARVHEAPAVALELLEDEALAAEQPGAEALRERDADRHALRRAQE